MEYTYVTRTCRQGRPFHYERTASDLSPLWLSSQQLGNLKYLGLTRNQLGDEGMKAFSTAISSGALAQLQLLQLLDLRSLDNAAAGMQAFSAAIASGSLGSLADPVQSDRRCRHQGLLGRDQVHPCKPQGGALAGVESN